MTIHLATENAGKIAEMRTIFAAALPQTIILSVADLSADIRTRYNAVESGTTYAENALIKARALAQFAGHIVLAEDSGFEVEALNREPGVYSARYAPDDAARCAKIIRALENTAPEKRRAQFVACVVILEEKRNPTFFFGRKEGYVAAAARGNQGFGYDPIFCTEPGKPTWGELGSEAKNRDSHRSRALAHAIQYMIARDSQK